MCGIYVRVMFVFVFVFFALLVSACFLRLWRVAGRGNRKAAMPVVLEQLFSWYSGSSTRFCVVFVCAVALWLLRGLIYVPRSSCVVLFKHIGVRSFVVFVSIFIIFLGLIVGRQTISIL